MLVCGTAREIGRVFEGKQSEEEAILEARHTRGSFHCSLVVASLMLRRHRKLFSSLMIQGDQWDAAFECLCIRLCTLCLSSALQLRIFGKALRASHASLAWPNGYMPITAIFLVTSVCSLLISLLGRSLRMPCFVTVPILMTLRVAPP